MPCLVLLPPIPSGRLPTLLSALHQRLRSCYFPLFMPCLSRISTYYSKFNQFCYVCAKFSANLVKLRSKSKFHECDKFLMFASERILYFKFSCLWQESGFLHPACIISDLISIPCEQSFIIFAYFNVLHLEYNCRVFLNWNINLKDMN